MKNIFRAGLGLIAGFVVLASNVSAAPPSVLLTGDGGKASLLLNKFPVNFNLLEDDYSITTRVAPVAFQKGSNELEVFFWAETTARYIINLRAFPHTEDITYVVEISGKSPDAARQVKVEIGVGEKKKEFTFEVPSGQHGAFLAEKGESVLTGLPEQFAEFDVALKISFENPNGQIERVPWIQEPAATTTALGPVSEAVASYVKAMNSGNLDEISKSLSLRWQLEEAGGGLPEAQRREGISKFLASGQSMTLSGDVKTIMTFPQSPIVLVAEQQIKMLRGGREMYPRLYLMPSKDGWKIVQ